MLRLNFYRVLMFAATCSLGLTASTAMAKGGKHGGHRGGHGRHIGHGHHGGRHIGYAGHGRQIGHHYGGYRYGGHIGHPRYGYGVGIGVGIAIGGGYHHRYRGFASPYGGYGYSVYSPYRAYRPYYPSRTGLWLGYSGTPAYDYLYDRAPARGYVYPQPQRYRAAKPAVPSAELRPGMILPDGSRVISVDPADEADAIAPEAAEADSPVPAPAIPEPNEPRTNDGGDEIEELPAVAPDDSSVKA